jgi:UDP-N-acetylglucosamine 1-carboxyvinyltransferase
VGSYKFKAANIDLAYLQGDVFRKKGASLRGSIMIIGPLLARFKKAYMPKPGGDKIGRRRLDTHFLGFEKLGATFSLMPMKHFLQLVLKTLLVLIFY